MRDTEIQLYRERDTETGWGTRHLPASGREAEHNCCGRKINNQKAGYRDEHGVTQGLTCGCFTHPTICRSSTINRHSKPKKCDFEFRFCQKCYKPPQNTKRGFSRREKNRVIYSTQPGIQTAKNIEVTSSANIIHRTLSKVQMSRDRHVGNSIKIQTQPVHAPPTKYIQRTFSKVQMSRDRHVGSSIKVQIQSRGRHVGSSTKVQIQCTLSKVQTSVSSTKYIQHTLSKVQISVSSARDQSMITQYRIPLPENAAWYLQKAVTLPKTTPYGPHNLPHMVLCTKKRT